MSFCSRVKLKTLLNFLKQNIYKKAECYLGLLLQMKDVPSNVHSFYFPAK